MSANWRPLQLLVPLLAEKVPRTEAVREGKRGGGGGGQLISGSPIWNGGERGIHCIEKYSNGISGLKSVTPRTSD